MQILRGFVKGVISKGEGDKAYAVVGIEGISEDRDGFEVSKLYKFNVRGQAFKDGLHNAYRSLKGSEVFAPYSDEIDTFYKDNPRIRYNLLGVPVRLQDAPAVQRPNPTSVPVSAGSSAPSSSAPVKTA